VFLTILNLFDFISKIRRYSNYSVGGFWVERLHLDTADSLSFNGSDLDVSLVSPAGTPRVSDDVVVLTTFSSVTNSGDGMIERSSTELRVHDT
jgi:hypothetical protein